MSGGRPAHLSRRLGLLLLGLWKAAQHFGHLGEREEGGGGGEEGRRGGGRLLWLVISHTAVLVVGTGSKAWEVPASPFSTSSNFSESLQWEPSCQYRPLQGGARITADMPPRLEGAWVSTRCEVRPGPEFLTRSYTFHASRQVSALQHYYADGGCERPVYSLSVRGKLRMRRASWITRGATEAEHHLGKVSVAVHDPAAAQKLAARLAPACEGPALGRMVPGRAYELYNTRAGRACLGALGFSMAEMGLVRVETRTHHGPHAGRRIQELFLGDIHTDWAQRTHHRPTGYQQPLQNAMRPPVLPRAAAAALALEGRWVSQRCEARPSVLFLTRDFTFHPDRHAWEGVYRHYSDPGCSQPTFTLRAAGHYAQGEPSPRLPGAAEMAFKVVRVKVTPWDESSLRLLNGTRPGHCGPPGSWEAGEERDVTPTAGCSALGIKLPHKEYELFKTELDPRKHPLLFTGERPTDGLSPDRPQRRPTSFQPPMVFCGGGGGGGGGGGKARPTHRSAGSGGSNSRQVQFAAGGSERRARLGLLVLGAAVCARFWVQ
ncbi:hypothetical protein NHX12_030864 [Muraenolepis orangiensis]|uniref:APCDD1 domain-containing protein n=1 Tax=Muraenolepis orangiensis TaxID=630683 RepID=A0A9Q0E9H0_9TELE|nr:hypothetical protein NHX12_030864 [Muraenolepis orangiensis]